MATCAPAALAAAIPAGESSKIRQSLIGTPSTAAAFRKPSGWGFPWTTSSAAIMVFGAGSPTDWMRSTANERGAEVTTAHEAGSSVDAKSRIPAIGNTPSMSDSSASRTHATSAATSVPTGPNRRIVSSDRTPCTAARSWFSSTSCRLAQARQTLSTTADEFSIVPSMSKRKAA